MPDFTTIGATAGAKPIIKFVFKQRPKKLMERAKKAEYKVTDLILERASLLTPTQLESLKITRKDVDEARRAAEEASWFKDTYKYWRIVYRYYESASLLLEETQRVTDGAARANGPEGCTNRNQPPNTGRVVSYTLDNVRLEPGLNTISVPFPNDVAYLCSVEVRAQTVAPDAGSPEQGSSEGEEVEIDGSATLTVTPDDAQDDGEDPFQDDIAVNSIKMSKLPGHRFSLFKHASLEFTFGNGDA